jgi:peptidoglycan/LPS O-acetylase OafA/YrhL
MVLVYLSGQLLVLTAVKVVGRYPIDPEFLLFLPPLHVSTFFLGVLLAKLRVDADKKQPASGGRSWASYALFLIVGISFVILGMVLPTSVTDSPIGQALLEDGVFSPFLCALIWALCDNRTIISRLLTMKWPLLLGEASYGLYLIHDPVLHLVVPPLVHALSSTSWREFRVLYLLSFLVYLAVCIALSIASYLWFEGPSRRWIRSRFGSRLREAGTRVLPDGLALGNSELRPSNSTSN